MMKERCLNWIAVVLMFVGIGLSPIAKSNDVALWSTEHQLMHPYSFISPVVADEHIYLSMFNYQSEHGWQGELKKFKLSTDGQLTDRNGEPVFDCTGKLLNNARSFWSSSVVNQAAANDVTVLLEVKASRQLLSNTGDGPAPLSLLPEDMLSKIPRFLGDSIHNQPRVLDYGHQHKGTSRRLLVGTNAGMLHLFNDADNTLDEGWVFIPAEFLSRVTASPPAEFHAHQYGLDGEISVFHDDKDHDGIIEADEGDKLWIFFGLRRGGRSYYALDLTDPDHLALKWKISGDDRDGMYKLLGETWSTPQLAYISAYGSAKKTVLVVGGGFDLQKDHDSTHAAQLGRAIYIIDADSGAKLFSISSDADSLNNLQAPLTDAIPADVALLDSDQDGTTDRLYAADSGGNVWRLDMVGDFSDWRMTKLAALGQAQNETVAGVRQFFGQPVIVRSVVRMETGKQAAVEVPADWVLLGSGDRAHPDQHDPVPNYYFALADRQVTPYKKAQAAASVLTLDTLQKINNTGLVADKANFSSGWYVDLKQPQEKVFGNGYVVAGQVWFTSFSPVDNNQSGGDSVGMTQLYRLDLQSGSFSESSPGVKLYHDQLLENLGVVYQASAHQLWMTGIRTDVDDKKGLCSKVGIPLSDIIKPRKISEYQTEY
ncbi:MAG: PilC/PilY family type IV pilus protein [Tolumonas sp.]|nr:PilC/PilY family type IV pilus protein [Tolumonas sp.]